MAQAEQVEMESVSGQQPHINQLYMRMKSLLRDEKRLKFAWEDIDYTWQRAKKDHTKTMQELKYTQGGLDSDLARQSGWAMKQLDSIYYRTHDQTLAASEAARGAVNTYGQVFCRQLCDTIQRKLPTELQVQIYDYVRGPAELQIEENSVTIDSKVGKITYLVDFDNPHGLQLMPGCSIEQLPHYRNAEYMGQEVVDRYFTVDLFHSLKFASQTLVGKFLSSDVFAPGLNPASLARKVTIILPTPPCPPCYTQQWTDATLAKWRDDKLNVERAVVTEALETILLFDSKAKLRLYLPDDRFSYPQGKFPRWCSSTSPWYPDEYFDPLLNKLKSLGYNFEFDYDLWY